MAPLIDRFGLAVGLLLLAPLLLGATAPAPRSGTTREVVDQGYRVRLDLSGQVLGLSIPEDRSFRGGEGGSVDAPIQPVLTASGPGRLVSASILAQKAKQFDDGLYAAVELAAQDGAGQFGGKAALLRGLVARLGETGGEPSGDAIDVVNAAALLGHVPVNLSSAREARARKAMKDFLEDPLRSRVIGFYTWSRPLSAIFQQDRMLQTELEGPESIAAVARGLHADPQGRAIYERYLTLVARLTNPLTGPSLEPLLADLDHGRSLVPGKHLAVFPASRAHETDLVKKLYGNSPIPEGFNLVEEMIRRIRSGELKLEPTRDSGWYDYQTWALEPLVIPEKMPEAGHLSLDESYRKQLIELFKGIIALTRETHIKQLEVPLAGAAAMRPRPKVKIYIQPELSAEPLATHYLRRAQGYRFVRDVLRGTFGEEGVRGMHRLTARGPVAMSLADELAQMEALFAGAAVTTFRQLGMQPPAAAADVGSGRGPGSDAATFLAWSRALGQDPDLGRDARMMVPVFYDLGRRMTKVWVFLGWSDKPVGIFFTRPPMAEVFRDGKKLEGDDAPELHFVGTGDRLAYPVTAEVYVRTILDREAFRRHCDRYKTQAAILKNLR